MVAGIRRVFWFLVYCVRYGYLSGKRRPMSKGCRAFVLKHFS